jgi:hypothetical protein
VLPVVGGDAALVAEPAATAPSAVTPIATTINLVLTTTARKCAIPDPLSATPTERRRSGDPTQYAGCAMMCNVIPTDDQGRSPFRAAVESKDFARVEATLAPAVVFRSPAVFAPYEGRDAVAALLRLVGTILTPALVYQWQARDGDREVLSFTSEAGGRQIEGVDLLRYDESGLVAELVVMMRPLSGLTAIRDAMGAALAAAAEAAQA